MGDTRLPKRDWRSRVPRLLVDRPLFLAFWVAVVGAITVTLWANSFAREGLGFWLTSIQLQHHHALEAAESVAKILAFLAAAVFAAVKLASGFYVTNLAIDLTCTRSQKDENEDYVSINVTLSKGDRGTLVISDAYLRITEAKVHPDNGEVPPRTLGGLGRLDLSALRQGSWRHTPYERALYLAPGDKLTLASIATFDRRQPCLIEVAVAGKTFLYLRAGEWRAATVSAPAPELPKKEEREPVK